MYRDKKFLAVIPARGGSKGVPRKNTRLLAGRPLLAYTADQVKNSALLDTTVVSTEDGAIAEVARALALRVVDRPPELATDTAPTEPCLIHALDHLAAAGECFDYVVVLEPTSPFRSAMTIDGAIRAIVDAGAPSLVAVSETRANIGRIENGRFHPLTPDAPRRRQERQPFYVESSTIYVCRADYLRQSGTLVTADWAAFVVPEAEAWDINTSADFAVAESLLAWRKKQ